MKEVITCRLTNTGIWRYEFFDHSRRRIGSASNSIIPTLPVHIEGFQVRWHSHFNMDSSIIPGTCRRVFDSNTEEEVFRLIYWRQNLYQVRTPNQSVQIELQNGYCLFGPQGMPATAKTEKIGKSVWNTALTKIMEPCFRTVFYEEVNEAYMMMVLSFPALKFF